MARSYEPLARRLCKALHDLMGDRAAQWIPVSKAALELRVANAELVAGAIAHASSQRWLMVGGQPVHSLILTSRGEAVAQKQTRPPYTVARKKPVR
jgi:hypothetical protein